MNISVVMKRGYGKTYRLVKEAIDVAVKDNKHKTVILVKSQASVRYTLKILKEVSVYSVEEKCLNAWEELLYNTTGCNTVKFKNGTEIIIQICNKENLIYFLQNDYNIFIDDIEVSEITNKSDGVVFGFSSSSNDISITTDKERLEIIEEFKKQKEIN